MNEQPNIKMTALKKRKKSKRKGLIGLTISFYNEESSKPKNTAEETVEDTVTITDESLFTHASAEVKQEDPATMPSPKRNKGKRTEKSTKALKSRKKGGERTERGDEAVQAAATEASLASHESSEGHLCLSDMIKFSIAQVEKERTLLLQKEQEASQLLQTERSKNKQLQTRIVELENQIVVGDDEPPRNTESDELASKIQMLEAENELLKQKTKRQEQVITNLASDQESKMKRQLSTGENGTVASATTRTSSFWSDVTSIRAFLDNVSEHSYGGRWESLEETSLDNFVNLASIPSGAKAQGEILQLRSTLGRTSKAYESQTEELSSLKQEVEELRKHLGLDPKDTSERRVRGAPRPSLVTKYRLSQSDLLSQSENLSQSDVNDMTLHKDLTNLLDF